MCMCVLSAGYFAFIEASFVPASMLSLAGCLLGPLEATSTRSGLVDSRH